MKHASSNGVISSSASSINSDINESSNLSLWSSSVRAPASHLADHVSRRRSWYDDKERSTRHPLRPPSLSSLAVLEQSPTHAKVASPTIGECTTVASDVTSNPPHHHQPGHLFHDVNTANIHHTSRNIHELMPLASQEMPLQVRRDDPFHPSALSTVREAYIADPHSTSISPAASHPEMHSDFAPTAGMSSTTHSNGGSTTCTECTWLQVQLAFARHKHRLLLASRDSLQVQLRAESLRADEGERRIQQLTHELAIARCASAPPIGYEASGLSGYVSPANASSPMAVHVGSALAATNRASDISSVPIVPSNASPRHVQLMRHGNAGCLDANTSKSTYLDMHNSHQNSSVAAGTSPLATMLHSSAGNDSYTHNLYNKSASHHLGGDSTNHNNSYHTFQGNNTTAQNTVHDKVTRSISNMNTRRESGDAPQRITLVQFSAREDVRQPPASRLFTSGVNVTKME